MKPSSANRFSPRKTSHNLQRHCYIFPEMPASIVNVLCSFMMSGMRNSHNKPISVYQLSSRSVVFCCWKACPWEWSERSNRKVPLLQKTCGNKLLLAFNIYYFRCARIEETLCLISSQFYFVVPRKKYFIFDDEAHAQIPMWLTCLDLLWRYCSAISSLILCSGRVIFEELRPIRTLLVFLSVCWENLARFFDLSLLSPVLVEDRCVFKIAWNKRSV